MASTYPSVHKKNSQNHGRLNGEHISERSQKKLKITVGCLVGCVCACGVCGVCTCGVWCWCCVCTCGVVCGVVWCVVLVVRASSLLLSLFLHVSFSFFFLLFFSFLFSLSSSLSLSFTAHTETRSDRQVTLPTENGHAPRDPLNQERAINLSILAMSHLAC